MALFGSKNDISSAHNLSEFIKNPKLDNFELLLKTFFTDKYTNRKFSKKITEDCNEDIDFFCQKIDEFNQHLQAYCVVNNTADLLKIVDNILCEFQKIKIANGLLDYDDLISITNQILLDPKNCEWIKLKMDYYFDHLLVDEAQDTNPIQWSIIKALIDDFFTGESRSSNSRSIFIVGDEKQSIMGFQGANIAKTKEFFDYLNYKSNQTLTNVDLNVSFRSGKNILKLVDCIFNNQTFKSAICKIGSYRNHVSYRSSVGLVEIWQCNNSSVQNNIKSSIEINSDQQKNQIFKNDNSSLSDKETLAKTLANKIKNWIDSKRLITDKNRPVEYGDIMILVRNRQNGLIEQLANNFSQLGIPYTSVGKIKFSENILIQDFLSLARFALLQSDDYNLACLLKSPFFNYTELQLYDLCIKKNNCNINLWESFDENEDKKGLNQIINLAKNNNLFDFFFLILKNKANIDNIITRFGYEGVDLINNFLLICQDFNNKNSPNLQNFLEFVEKIDPEISITNNHPNRIKITTIHSSKGLQAPIVIIPDCLYNYSKQIDNREKILWDDNFPLWINKNAKINSYIKKIFDNKIIQNYEEHLRLLYVALTRAEDEIYITGLSKEYDEKCWYNIISSLNESFIKKVEIKYDYASSIKNSHENNHEFKKFEYTPNYEEFDFPKINSALIFGDYLHKALEIIGKNYIMPDDWLINFINKYFQNFYQLTQQNCEKIINIIRNYLNSDIYRHLFKKDENIQINCEYEILYDKQKLRIDLLKIYPKEILILDYKSDDKMPKKIPQNYHQQLQLYQKAIKKYYPNHEIKCAILWIRFLKLDYIV